MGLKNKKQSMDSHMKQYIKPLYSTIYFERFLNKYRCFNAKKILDAGCGCGAVTDYMAQKHPDVNFTGLDYNRFLVKNARQIRDNNGRRNMEFVCGDISDLLSYYKEEFDGVYNVHALCCMKRMEPMIDNLAKTRPNWIAFNSLFYEGTLDVLIHIRDLTNPAISDNNPDGDFNIFSLASVRRHLLKKGYRHFYYERFEIPQKLKKPPEGKRGTYTIRTEMGPRTQFSGPIYLPWYFVLARKGK